MANIIAKYIVSVFDNGDIVTELEWKQKQIEKETELDLNNCGGRFSQLLSVIYYAFKDEGKIEERIQRAIRKTANKYGITISSCHDKITRQIRLTLNEFRSEVEKLFKMKKNDSFKEYLLGYVGNNTSEYDARACEELFSIIENS